MKTKNCIKCGKEDLVWKQSKKGKWYLAETKEWWGDQFGTSRTYFPGHRCTEQQQVKFKQQQELEETQKREDHYMWLAEKNQDYFDDYGVEREWISA
jgi:ssDNA-binding Zn-finger/Zn-ribbon topoisomerase 1